MESVKEKIKEKAKKTPLNKIRGFSLHIFYAVVAFFMGSINFAGGISPFAVAFTAAALPEYLLPVALGSAGGYLAFCSSFDALQYVGAVTLICFVKYFSSRFVKPSYRLYAYSLTGFCALLFSSLLVGIAKGIDGAEVLLCFAQALICAAISCFFFKIFNLFIAGMKKLYVTSSDTAAFLFFLSSVLLALDNFPVFGVSFSHIAAGFLIMLFSFCGKEASGSMSGVCCGVTLGFSSSQPHLLFAYPLSGLLTGVCSEYGKGAAAVSFFVSQILALIIMGDAVTAAYAVGESIASAVIFLLIPQKVLKKAAERLSPLSRDAFEYEASEILTYRIKKSAKAIKDVSQSVAAVSSILAKTDCPKPYDIPALVKDDVCSDCIKKDFCWEKSKQISEQTFKQAESILLKKGRLTPDTLPERLNIVCRAPNSIAESFNRYYCEYNAKVAVRHEILDTKALAASQFLSVSRILDDTAEKAKESFRTDAVTANYAKEIFLQEGFSFSSLLARTDSFGRSFIEVFCTKIPVTADFTRLLEELYMRTDIEYMLPEKEEYSDFGTVLSFCEKTVYMPEFAMSTHTGAGENFSGDTCRSFFDGKGNFYVILSDGMGSGQRAALDSLMTCSLMSKLILAGFSPQCALESVNSALMVKSDDETLATLDMLKIDLYTGKAEFYKAGAAFSVLRKADRTALVEQSSLPLGILKEAKFEKTQVDLTTKDSVLLISDGAAILSPNHFKDIFHKKKSEDPQKLTEEVVRVALELSESGKNDDITAAFVRIKKN